MIANEQKHGMKKFEERMNVRLFYSSFIGLTAYVLMGAYGIFNFNMAGFLALMLSFLNALLGVYYLWDAIKNKPLITNYGKVKRRIAFQLIYSVVLICVVLARIYLNQK